MINTSNSGGLAILMLDKPGPFLVTKLMLIISLVLISSCGGGGGVSKSASNNSTPGTPTTITPARPPPATPLVSNTPVVTGAAVDSGAIVINIPDTKPTYVGSYVGSYRALFNDIYVVKYNKVADELIVVGNILAQGTPGIQGLDPTTFAVRWSLPIPSTSDVLAISDDGTKAFVGLCAQMSVAQIDLTTHTIDTVFSIANPAKNVCAGDIAVRPGYPTVIAVTQIVQNVLAPASYGTAMFSNGVPLINAVNNNNSMFFVSGSVVYTSSATLKFLDSNNLIGYSSFLSTPQIQRYSVSASGLTLTGIQATSLYDNFTIHNGLLYFDTGQIASVTDLSGYERFTHCQSDYQNFYQVAIPDPIRPEIICAASVPNELRLAPKDIEFEISSWSLLGARVTHRTHLNLRDIIQIQGLATAEVNLLSMVALPNGQLILHIYDFQSNQLILVGITTADLTAVSDPPINYGHLTQSGTTIDWASVPITETAYDPNTNRIYGIVPGSYGPNGSSLVAIDKSSKKVIGFVPFNYEPTKLTITSDGQFAYVTDGVAYIQQVNLNSLTLGWSWLSTDCGISSITARPGFPHQVVDVGGRNINLIDNGSLVSSITRTSFSGCTETGAFTQTGTALFTASNRLIEFLPEIGTSSVNVYNISSGNLSANGQVKIGFSMGGGAYRDFAGLGFIYNDSGDIADQATLTISTVAPTTLSYILDQSANMAVSFPNNSSLGGSCGCSTVSAFTPLSSTRFLAAHQNLPGVGMFDVMTGTQRTGRLILTDTMIGQSFMQQLTPIDPSNFAFGQAAQGLGQGSLYFIQLPF